MFLFIRKNDSNFLEWPNSTQVLCIDLKRYITRAVKNVDIDAECNKRNMTLLYIGLKAISFPCRKR